MNSIFSILINVILAIVVACIIVFLTWTLGHKFVRRSRYNFFRRKYYELLRNQDRTQLDKLHEQISLMKIRDLHDISGIDELNKRRKVSEETLIELQDSLNREPYTLQIEAKIKYLLDSLKDKR